MFTTVAFSESQSLSNLGKVATIADEHVTVSGDDLTIPELNQVLGALFLSDNLQDARLVAPSLRELWLEDIPLLLDKATLQGEQAVDESGSAVYTIHEQSCLNDFRDNPLPLVRSEKLNAEIHNGGNAERGYVLVWLGDGSPGVETGLIRTIKATGSTTLTANAWTNVPLSFQQSLPAGRYRVVGMRPKSANALAARLVFVGGGAEGWRPGTTAVNAYSDVQPGYFRRGRWGSFGEFEFDQPPTVEFLASAGDTSEIVWLDLIQVRSGR